MKQFNGLEQVDFLREVPVQVLAQLRQFAQECRFAAGEIISAQGGEANFLYLLLEGEVEVVQTDAEGFEHRIVTLGQGEIFGERALLMEDRRSADVIAAGEVRVARLPWPALRALMQQYHSCTTTSVGGWRISWAIGAYASNRMKKRRANY